MRSPVEASTPARITEVSLGTSGMTASSAATAKRKRYVHGEPETYSVSDSNTCQPAKASARAPRGGRSGAPFPPRSRTGSSTASSSPTTQASCPGSIATTCGADEVERAPVLVLALDAAAGEEADVGVHAPLAPHRRAHVRRPAEAGRVDGPLHAAVPDLDDLDDDTAHLAALGALDRLQ